MLFDAGDVRFIPPPPPPPGPPPHMHIGVPPPPPPGPPPMQVKVSPLNRNIGQSIVEERRRAAMAIYQSTELVPDHPLPTIVVKSPVVPLAVSVSSSQSPNENRPPLKHALLSPPPSTQNGRSVRSPSTIGKAQKRQMSINTKNIETNNVPKTPASSTSRGSMLSSGKSEGKKGFFRGILARNKNSPSPSSTPTRSLAAATTTTTTPTTTRSPSPRTRTKIRRRKKEIEKKLGMPLDAKPGSSYKSTPHSAEIVPRTASAGEGASEGLAILTATEAKDVGISPMESFSPPSFELSPINFPSDQFPEMRFNDDISILTDPSYSEHAHKKLATRMDPIGEDEGSTDQLEREWNGNANRTSSKTRSGVHSTEAQPERGIDPFGDPFFVEDHSVVTEYPDTRYEPAASNSGNRDGHPVEGFAESSDEPATSEAERRHQMLAAKSRYEPLQVSKQGNPDGRSLSSPMNEKPTFQNQLPSFNQLREAARRSLLSDDETSAAQSHHSVAHSGNSAISDVDHAPSVHSRPAPAMQSMASSSAILTASKSQYSPTTKVAANFIKQRRAPPELDRARSEEKEAAGKEPVVTKSTHEINDKAPFVAGAYPIALGVHHPTKEFQKKAPSAQTPSSPGSVATLKALGLLRGGRTARSPSPGPSHANPKAATSMAHEPRQKTENRASPGLHAAKSPFVSPKRKRPITPRQRVSPALDNEILIPARAPKLRPLSKIAKQGRKPLYSKADPKVFKFATPAMLKVVKAAKPFPTGSLKERRKPPTYYIKKRRVLVESSVVHIGVAALHRERQRLISQGLATPAARPGSKISRSRTADTVDESNMDPIQRAGYRLLSKAAVPIQAEIRRYLAQREAVDRMWALIQLQSYFRRWRCEAYRYAHTWAATKIQAAFRGWWARDKLDEKAFAAVEIQRVVRGHLSRIRVYDRFYSLVTIQCVVRGWICRTKARQRLGTIIILQSCCRRFLARLEVQKMHAAATAIQATYRGYSAQLHFQFDLVDVIIAQSIVRRWKACKIASCMRDEQRELSATTIQSAWRGFQAYSDFIFAIADVLVAQRTVRGWLSRRKSQRRRLEEQATKIQSQWRRYRSQMTTLYKLVHLIIVQSVVRRRLAMKRVSQLRIEIWAARTIQVRWRVLRWRREKKCQSAATTIQAAWRRFWGYSHYLILSYEVVRIQSCYRGHRARREANLQMGCAIIIQSMMRRLLGFKKAQQEKLVLVLVASGSECLRENYAARRIQRFWHTSLTTKRELRAAAVIHRFFAMVRIEVDREITRQRDKMNKKKGGKSRRKSRDHHESEDKMLERAWLNTMEHDPYGRTSRSNPRARMVDSDSSQSRSNPHMPGHRNAGKDRPKPDLAGQAVDVRPFDEVSEVTGPTVFNRAAARVNTLTRKEMSEDLTLEEAWIDTEVCQVKQRRQAEQEYLQRHGLQHHGSYQHRDSRYYAPNPLSIHDHRINMAASRRHQSPLPLQLTSMHPSHNRHPSSSMHQPPAMHPSSRHDMHYSVPPVPVPRGPFPQTRNHFDSSRRHRYPGRHSSFDKPRYADPGYYQGGGPSPYGGYGRHDSSVHATRTQGYPEYQPPHDRSGYY